MPVVTDIKHTTAPAFPLRFDATCDLPLVYDDEAIKQNMRSAVFIPVRSLPLKTDIGSEVPHTPMEPNDTVQQRLLQYSVRNAIENNEPRVLVSGELRAVASLDINTLEMTVPFLFRNSNQQWKTLKLDLAKYGPLV
jgi:phage baseplate assembly protein W